MVTVTTSAPSWFHVAFAAAFCLFGLYYLFRNLRRARMIEDVPTARVRSAPQGYIELEGVAEAGPDGLLSTPLTGADCCWYRYKVEKRHGKGWRTLDQEASAAPYVLRDDTGVCLVYPDKAEVTPADRSVWYGNRRRPLDRNPRRDPVRPPRLGAPSTWFQGVSLVAGHYRYTEERIYPGDPIYAIGQFHTEGEHEHRSERDLMARELLRRWKSNKPNLLARFDRDGDGDIDLEEWELARQAARREAGTAQRVLLRSRIRHRLAAPDEGGHPFLISSLPQFDLVRRYRWFAALSLIPFFGGAVAVTWMLV